MVSVLVFALCVYILPATASANYTYLDGSATSHFTNTSGSSGAMSLDVSSSYSVGRSLVYVGGGTGQIPNGLGGYLAADGSDFPSNYVSTGCDRSQGATGSGGSSSAFAFGGYSGSDGVYALLFSFGTSQDGFGTPQGCISGYAILVQLQGGIWSYYQPAIPDTSTRFVSIYPSATTTATTTQVQIHAYINTADFPTGQGNIHIDFYNPTVAALSANVIDACNVFGSAQCSLDFPFATSTSGIYATSSIITFNYGGTIKAKYTITRPNTWSSLWLIGGLFAPDVVATVNTSFVVGYQTLFDQALNGNGTATSSDSSGLVGYFTTGGTSSTTVVASGCAGIFTNGSIVSCLVGLVVPSGQDMSNDWQQLYNGMLAKVPFGYATRFLTIMSGNAGAVEPPALSYTFGSSSPAVLQGKTYTVNIWDYMGSSSPLILAKADDGSNKDIWDIVMPYFNIVISLAVFLAILSDLFGFEMGFDATQHDQYVKNQSRMSKSENDLAEQAQLQANKGGDNGMGTLRRRKRRY